MVLQPDVRVAQVLPQGMVEYPRALERAAGEKELRIKRVLAGRGDVRPEREQFEAALIADRQFFIQRLEVGQANERGLERLLGQMSRLERRVLRREGLQRAVGVLDAPAKLAPQPHEQVNAQEDNRIGLDAVAVLQRGQI